MPGGVGGARRKLPPIPIGQGGELEVGLAANPAGPREMHDAVHAACPRMGETADPVDWRLAAADRATGRMATVPLEP